MITSTSSSQVKHIVNLQKKSKLRKEEKQFVVEGIKMVSEAPRDRLVKVYVSETFKADNEEFLKKMNYEKTFLRMCQIMCLSVCQTHRHHRE